MMTKNGETESAVYLMCYRYKGGSYSGTIVATDWNDAARKCAALGVELTGKADPKQYKGVH